MPRRPITPPVRGAANNTGFSGTPDGFAPAARLLNVRPFDVDTKRPRVGQRPGIARLFNRQLGRGLPVQALGVVSRASAVVGDIVGSCVSLKGGESRTAGAITGQLWGLEPVPAMERDVDIDAPALTPVSGSTANATADAGGSAVALTPDGTRAVIAVNIPAASSSTGQGFYIVSLVDTSTGEVLDTAQREGSGVTRFVNTLHIAELPTAAGGTGQMLVFACESVARVTVFNIASDTLAGWAIATGNQWASEFLECGTWATGSKLYLFAAFMGADTSGKYGPAGAGTISNGYYAKHFRAGVMKFEVTASGALGALTQVAYGAQLPPTDAWVEYDGGALRHDYFRISEQTNVGRPHGARINAMHVHTDGSVVLARCNQGWGPNGSYPPDGLQAAYVTIMRIDPVGVTVWERDTDSILEQAPGGEHGFPFWNDIPSAANPDPSILAVRFDAAGDVYCAGRQQSGGVNVFKLRGTDGVEIWRANIMDSSRSVRQAGIWIDPSDQTPIIAGDRNTGWTGSGGANAHLWKLNAISGAIIWAYDIGQNVSATGVAVDADGKIWYCTDFVS